MYECPRNGFVPKFLKKNKFELLPRHSCSPPQLRSARKAAAPYSLTCKVRANPPPPKIACPLSLCCFYFECSTYFFGIISHSTTFGVHHLASSLLLDLSLLYATIQGHAHGYVCSTLAPPCALGTRPAAPLSKVYIYIYIFFGFAISNVA